MIGLAPAGLIQRLMAFGVRFLIPVCTAWAGTSFICSLWALTHPSCFDFPKHSFWSVCHPRRPSSLSNNAGIRIRHRNHDSTSPPLCRRSFGFGKAVISNYSDMPVQLQLGGQFDKLYSVFFGGGGLGFVCG